MRGVLLFSESFAVPERIFLKHPQANASIALHGALLHYLLRRSARRRSIGLRVNAQGLTVSAPPCTPLHDIEAVLCQRAVWIARCMAQATQHKSAQQAAAQWRAGGSVPFLGTPITLRLAGTASATLQGDELLLPLPAAASAQEVRCAAQTWLLGQARRMFTRQLDEWAPRVGVRWQRLTVSRARTRWGSASADGAIRLNRRLIHLPPELVDYVVVHELAHLHEMNHSARFWQHVERALPDYEARSERLRRAVTPAWDD